MKFQCQPFLLSFEVHVKSKVYKKLAKKVTLELKQELKKEKIPLNDPSLDFIAIRNRLQEKNNFNKKNLNKITGLAYRDVKSKKMSVFAVYLKKFLNNKKKKSLFLKSESDKGQVNSNTQINLSL